MSKIIEKSSTSFFIFQVEDVLNVTLFGINHFGITITDISNGLVTFQTKQGTVEVADPIDLGLIVYPAVPPDTLALTEKYTNEVLVFERQTGPAEGCNTAPPRITSSLRDGVVFVAPSQAPPRDPNESIPPWFQQPPTGRPPKHFFTYCAGYSDTATNGAFFKPEDYFYFYPEDIPPGGIPACRTEPWNWKNIP